MPDDDEDDRRRRNPGRRAEDYLYESLVDRLSRLEGRLERAIEKFEAAVERLADQIRKTEKGVHKRVDELEDYHISEQANTRVRVADRAKSLESWQKWAVGGSLLSAGVALAALIVSLTH